MTGEIEAENTGDGGVDPDVEHETWRLLSFWAAVTAMGVAAGVMLINQVVIPPLIVFLVLFAVGLFLLQRPGKVGPIVIGVLSILFFVGNVPFIVEDLAHPESFFGFFPTATGVLAAILGVVAMIGFLRRWKPGLAGRVFAVIGGLVVVTLVGSLVATLSLDDDVRQEGDVDLTAEAVEWEPDELTVDSGEVAVFIQNEDPYRHTFTIEGIDVDTEVPASTDRRVTFTADPGEYTYTCEVPGHEDMDGRLTVG